MNLEQFNRLLHYQSLIVIHTIYTYNKYVLKPIILVQHGDKPRCLHLILIDVVLTFEIKLYTVFPRFWHISP